MRFDNTASRVRSSGACHSTISSKVRLGSSIIAHSSPASPSTSTRRSSLPSSVRPSELASRRAGSIVSTATFFPRAAMPRAIAAEVVVFPTPPEPAQMQTCLRSSQRSITARAPAGPRELVQLLGAELGLEQERKRGDRRVEAAPETAKLRALAADPLVFGERGAHGAVVREGAGSARTGAIRILV